jgi:hypothetical protein
MTKRPEKGENEITDEAKREAVRTNRNVCAILADMLARAKLSGDRKRQQKIKQAQKFLGCRNIRKRRSKR